MQPSSASLFTAVSWPVQPLDSAWYSILGVLVSVASDDREALHCIDATYAAFRCLPATSEAALALQLRRLDDAGVYIVSDSHGYMRHWSDPQAALLDLLDQLVHGLLRRWHAAGMITIHAGALVYQHGALILAGRSGQGKTTSTLGLLRRGLGLLSDELAAIDPATQQIVAYRRSLHIRPGTIALIPELSFLWQTPRYQLGGGNEWALTPDEIERVFPGCLGTSAPLRYVCLLDGVPANDIAPKINPIPAAVAAFELLRGSWASSVDFEGCLQQIGRLLDNVQCVRLRLGALDATLDTMLEWLERAHG